MCLKFDNLFKKVYVIILILLSVPYIVFDFLLNFCVIFLILNFCIFFNKQISNSYIYIVGLYKNEL